MGMKMALFTLVFLIAGMGIGFIFFTRIVPLELKKVPVLNGIVDPVNQSPEVVGFLPYWLIDKADKDYGKYVTTLAYFGVTVDTDGSIKKMANPTETEPGWYALQNGKVESFMARTKKDNAKLSLVAFSGNEDAIYTLIDNPKQNARTLVDQVEPVMKRYGFSDLNLDIESVNPATPEARLKFTAFVYEVKSRMDARHIGTLSIDVSPTALIKEYLIDVKAVGPLVDTVIFMDYDFHYPGSAVTGPVAPLAGAGTESEFDTEASTKYALTILPAKKIIVGIPLYGYEWETLGDTPRSAVIPGSGIAASNRRVEDLLSSCSSCSAELDEKAQEQYLIYRDGSTGTFHQFFYPDKNATAQKVKFAKQYKLAGVGLWALGYEGNTILDPLESYIQSP